MSNLISFISFSLGAEQHGNVIDEQIKEKVLFPNGRSDANYANWFKVGTDTQKLAPDRVNMLIAQVGKELDPSSKDKFGVAQESAAVFSVVSPVKKGRKPKEDDEASAGFKDYIKRNWFDTVKPQKTDAVFNDLKAKAYRLYLASARSLLPFKVLGDDGVRVDKCLQANVGRLYTPTEGKLIGRLGPEEVSSLFAKNDIADREECEPLRFFGSVLYDKDWNIMKNDAVILGCIHANQPAYLTVSINTLASMDDENFFSGKFIKVCFREILQLAAAGYKMVIPDAVTKDGAMLDLDNIILVSDKSIDSTSQIAMEDMLSAVDGIDSAAKVREALGKIECISYRDYMAGVSSEASDGKKITLSDVCKITSSRPDSAASADKDVSSAGRSSLSASVSSIQDVDSLLDHSSVNLLQDDATLPS